MANAAPVPNPDRTRRLETFDVVLIKATSAGPHAALPEDFRRVTVQTESTLAASMHDDVEKAKAEAPGWEFLFVASPGVMTEPENIARQRAHSSAYAFNSSKAKFVG